MRKIEKNIVGFIKNNYLIIGFIIISILAIFLRGIFLNFKSQDFSVYLKPLFNSIVNNGGLKALATYKSDYNAPYITILCLLSYIPIKSIYLIKSVSIISDFILAISCAALVSYLSKKNKKEVFFFTYSIILFLPNVVLNGSVWAQCDSLYTSFVILSLLYLIKKKYIPSFILLGVAFAFKLQTVFILPLYVVIYLFECDFSILYFLFIPIVNFILWIPALIMGRSIQYMFSTYYVQIIEYCQANVYNFPNIYNIIDTNSNMIFIGGIVFTLVICLLAIFYLIYKKVKLNNEKKLLLGLWFVVIVTYFLPRMHERYLFMGEILAFIIWMAYRRGFKIMITVFLLSLITYASYLFDIELWYFEDLSIVYLIIIVYFTKYTFKFLTNSE